MVSEIVPLIPAMHLTFTRLRVGLGGTRKLSRNVALGFEGSLASIHLSGDEQAFASASASGEIPL